MGASVRLRLKGRGGITGGPLGPLTSAYGPVLTPGFFAMHVSRLPQTTIWGDYSASAAAGYHQTPLFDLGYGRVRLWDSDGCSWRNIERAPGVYSWARLDNAIALCEAAGKGVILTLGCGPDWATTAPGQMPGLYVGYNPHPPASNAVWQSWCTTLATRYAGKHIAFEIWNEVNDHSFGPGYVGSGYTGSAARLGELTTLAASAIRAADSTALIISPNFVSQEGLVGSASSPVDLTTFLATGAGATCDVIAIHGYNTLPPWRWPEGTIELITQAKAILKRYNLEKPLWNTEWGYGTWQTSEGATVRWPDEMPDELAKAFLTRMAVISAAGGLSLYGYYAMDAGTNWATIQLVDPATSGPPTAAGEHYRAVAEFMIGKRFAECVKAVTPAGLSYYSTPFLRETGRSAKIVWAPEWRVVDLPLTTGMVVTTLDGTLVPTTEGSVRLGVTPLIVGLPS